MGGYCEDCGETICVCQNPHDVLSKWTDDITRQLEAAKQRELELLAVIEAMVGVVGKHLDPHQALSKHEANVLEWAADSLPSDSECLCAYNLRRMAEERRKK